MVFRGSKKFPLVPSGFWKAISRKGAIEIMLLPESLHVQSCALPFAEQKLLFLY